MELIGQFGQFINAGVAGVVLAWFMVRAEKRLDKIMETLGRAQRVQLLDILTRPKLTPEVKEIAQGLISELDPKNGNGR